MEYQLKRIAFGSDMIGTRFLLTFGALLWALFLLWPSVLFTETRLTYRFMAMMASEEVWGVLFLIQGLFSLNTMFHPNQDKSTLWMDGVLGCILWTASTVACFSAYWPMYLDFSEAIWQVAWPAAMSGEVMLTMAAWWNLVRIWADSPVLSNNVTTIFTEKQKCNR